MRGLTQQFLPVARDGHHALGRPGRSMTKDDEHGLDGPKAERYARAALFLLVRDQRRDPSGFGVPEFRLFAGDAEAARRLEALRTAVGDEVHVGLRQTAVDISQRPAGLEVGRHALLGQPLRGRLAGHHCAGWPTTPRPASAPGHRNSGNRSGSATSAAATGRPPWPQPRPTP